MKICVISSAAIPSPTDGYAGLEMITAWFTQEAVKKGHDVTLVTTKGSQWEGTHDIVDETGNKISQLRVIGTVDPSWNDKAEQNHYMVYRNLIESEFSDGNSVIWDNTWACFSYLSKKQFPDMNIVHTHHGLIGFRTGPPFTFPRWVGLSTPHAQLMSASLNIPVRHTHNGIPLPKFEEGYDPLKYKGDYLLSLNRITDEKGIHDSIDVAMHCKVPIIIAGDDTKVVSQKYVNQIIERCRNSNGLAQYMGLVDSQSKNRLIQGCKALIACPKFTWQEAFGLYVVEGGAYCKPFLGTSTSLYGIQQGYTDIIENGVNGFLAPNPELLKQYVEKIDDIDPMTCRHIVEQKFSKEVMTDNYLNIFQKIIDKDNSANW